MQNNLMIMWILTKMIINTAKNVFSDKKSIIYVNPKRNGGEYHLYISLVNVPTAGNCRDCKLRERIGCILGETAGYPPGKRTNGCPMIPHSVDARRRRESTRPYMDPNFTTCCSACGGEIDDGDCFCRYCGVPILWDKSKRNFIRRPHNR